MATIEVKDYLTMTDTLSAYINENDKTPSWDGIVIIYKNNKAEKKDIIGKITVQVKGKMVESIKGDELSFSVDMVDLKNYKNDGGTIFFVVLIQNIYPKNRRVYYETLTPLKIDNYINGHNRQKTRTIKLKRLPEEKYEIQTIFYNFCHNSKKQNSFSSITPIKLNTLLSSNYIEEITTSLTLFRPNNNPPSAIQALLNNEVYWYAKVANSPILHPIELCTIKSVISKDGFPPVFVNGVRYENYVSSTTTKDEITYQFGESTTLVFNQNRKQARLNYKQSDSLRTRIKDLTFIISILTNEEIVFGENKKFKLGQIDAETPYDLVSIKMELKLYKRIEQFWKSLHILADFDIGNIDINSSLEELCLLMKSINGKHPIRIDIDGEYTKYMFRKHISNFKILFFLDAVNKEKSLYKIYNFFDYKGILKIVKGKTEYISSHYSALTTEDYIELSNINYSKMLFSYKKLIHKSNNIFEAANSDLLNLLLAYDKHKDHPIKILNTAKDIAIWLMNESKDKLPTDIKILNYLQTIKRERVLSSEENKLLYGIANDKDSNLMNKLGANLLLENYIVAKIQFEQLNDHDKELFKSFPIFKFCK